MSFEKERYMTAKSYAREIAVFVLAIALLTLGYAVYTQDAIALDVGKFLTLPAIGLIAAAFGLDKYTKQVK
jgi:hypothetical protein